MRSWTCRAIANASNGKAVGIVAAVRQPTMRRKNTSIANAVNTIPAHVLT